jgi:hypothetical protein
MRRGYSCWRHDDASACAAEGRGGGADAATPPATGPCRWLGGSEGRAPRLWAGALGRPCVLDDDALSSLSRDFFVSSARGRIHVIARATGHPQCFSNLSAGSRRAAASPSRRGCCVGCGRGRRRARPLRVETEGPGTGFRSRPIRSPPATFVRGTQAPHQPLRPSTRTPLPPHPPARRQLCPGSKIHRYARCAAARSAGACGAAPGCAWTEAASAADNQVAYVLGEQQASEPARLPACPSRAPAARLPSCLPAGLAACIDISRITPLRPPRQLHSAIHPRPASPPPPTPSAPCTPLLRPFSALPRRRPQRHAVMDDGPAAGVPATRRSLPPLRFLIPRGR